MFSIRALILIVLIAAVCAAGFASASEAWAALISTILVFSLLCSILAAAILPRGRLRAFWIGFAIFGLGTLLLMNSWLTNRVNLIAATKVVSQTARALGNEENDDMDAFIVRTQVGHAIYVWLFACSGGAIGYMLSRSVERTEVR